jgi:enoyl-CoA hydratase/carnithine racemase
MLDVERQGEVAVVRWDDGENRFNTASVARWHEVLDELAAVEGPLAVVITGTGKFFSNGLDLDAFAAEPESAGHVVDEVHRLFGRLLLLPAYTVAALNGHTFAGGAMLACCVDSRVMRSDRGYWCLPEADLGLPLTDAMFAAVTARLPVAVAAEAMNTGRRYGAVEAAAVGIVDHVAPEDEVLPRAVAIAAEVAPKDRAVIARHKELLFADAARVCGVEA